MVRSEDELNDELNKTLGAIAVQEKTTRQVGTLGAVAVQEKKEKITSPAWLESVTPERWQVVGVGDSRNEDMSVARC